MLLAALALLLLLGVVLAIALRAQPKAPPLQPPSSWAQGAGDEFAGLSEADRCDLIFAVAALEDERSHELLERALDDPSETVALAAARGLTRHGGASTLERYLAQRPGERARRIAQTLELLA